MNRTSINFLLDVLLLLVMLGLIITGGIIYFILPPGTGHSHLLFNLGRHDFGQIHFYLAIMAIGLITIHVVLHWNWICGCVARTSPKTPASNKARALGGVVILILIILFLVVGFWWASGKVNKGNNEGPKRYQYQKHGMYHNDLP